MADGAGTDAMSGTTTTPPSTEHACTTCKATLPTQRELHEHNATNHGIVDETYAHQQRDLSSWHAVSFSGLLVEANATYIAFLQAVVAGVKSANEVRRLAEAAEERAHELLRVCRDAPGQLQHICILAGDEVDANIFATLSSMQSLLSKQKGETLERLTKMEKALQAYGEAETSHHAKA